MAKKAPKISSVMTQISDTHNLLHEKSITVNVRLLKENANNKSYWIRNLVKFMIKTMNTTFIDYDKLKGISGANIGVPLRIMCIRLDDETILTMINPYWLESVDGKTKLVSSNCGSINLEVDKIKVKRWTNIRIYYYDIVGNHSSARFIDREAFTVQHEYDHTLGKLITDY